MQNKTLMSLLALSGVEGRNKIISVFLVFAFRAFYESFSPPYILY